MSTSKLDRLNKLFEGDQRIDQADPDKPHITDLDFMPKVTITKQAMPDPTPSEQPSKILKVPQYPGNMISPLPPPARRDLDLLTSSDEDEYVAAFANNATAKKPPMNSRRSGKSRSGGYKVGKPLRGDFMESSNGLSNHDGDGNLLTGRFCPLNLVAKFPYKYMVDPHDRVSRHFFAQNKFYQRRWEIYYIDLPGSMMAKPIILLRLDQVQQLINQINRAFKTDIACPPDPFTVSFFDDGTPQPKFLGTSGSRDDLTDMQTSIPTVPDNYADHLEDLLQEDAKNLSSSGLVASSTVPKGPLIVKPSERSFAEFRAKMERILASTKKDKQLAKKKKMDDRFLRQQDWVKQLKRAQRYLGLRPKATELPVLNSTFSWAEQQKRQEQDLRACGILIDPLDIGKAAPYAFENDPVIVCVDVESYERDHTKITEIGVSTLDTLDLAGIPLGKGGENWIAQIRSRHFRIRGREHLVNKDFCPGDANNFKFGQSEWVNLDVAAEMVDQCFEYPFSAHFKTGNVSGRAAHQAASSSADVQKGSTKRKIVFLGHDIRNEVDYLRRLGCQIFRSSCATDPEINAYGGGRSEIFGSILEALDTAVLYRVLVKDTQSQSLGKIMVGLGRTAWHLHNAGNDARYTLEALIALLIKARILEDEPNHHTGKKIESESYTDADTSWKDEVGRRVEEKTNAVEQGAREERKVWEKALHTMTITDNSGKQVEVEDPWLMAQESDQEFSEPPAGKEEEDGKWIDAHDTKIIMYRDPAATDGQSRDLGSADMLNGGNAEDGGLAKMVTERAWGAKKSGRRRGEGAKRGTEGGSW